MDINEFIASMPADFPTQLRRFANLLEGKERKKYDPQMPQDGYEISNEQLLTFIKPGERQTSKLLTVSQIVSLIEKSGLKVYQSGFLGRQLLELGFVRTKDCVYYKPEGKSKRGYWCEVVE